MYKSNHHLSFIDMLLSFAELWNFHSTQHSQRSSALQSISTIITISLSIGAHAFSEGKKRNSINWCQWQHGGLISEWHYNDAWHFHPGSTKHTSPEDKCFDRVDVRKWGLLFSIATWHLACYWCIFTLECRDIEISFIMYDNCCWLSVQCAMLCA